jgi:hypothetical protein
MYRFETSSGPDRNRTCGRAGPFIPAAAAAAHMRAVERRELVRGERDGGEACELGDLRRRRLGWAMGTCGAEGVMGEGTGGEGGGGRGVGGAGGGRERRGGVGRKAGGVGER